MDFYASWSVLKKDIKNIYNPKPDIYIMCALSTFVTFNNVYINLLIFIIALPHYKRMWFLQHKKF